MAAAFPTVGLAAEERTTHNVSDKGDVLALIDSAAVSDGDTIHIEGSGSVRTNDEAPWEISKSVTIEGGTLQVEVSGIILSADVTFRGVGLSFNKAARNAIMANGHTLTLENVTCANYSFNLFCGGLIDTDDDSFTPPAPGTQGVINIRGATTLQNRDTFGSGNIYAGNLSMGGMDEANNGPEDNAPPNQFDGDALINIEGSANSTALGTIYACGAQQRIPVGEVGGKETTPNSQAYTVSGAVTVTGAVPSVEGAGSASTHVSYRDVSGNGYLSSPKLADISSLSVESGYLAPQAGTCFRNEASLSAAPGAKLDVSSLPDFEAGGFTGGGVLILGQSQTLRVTGAVTGTTQVAVGGANSNGQSTAAPSPGHTYIHAPDSVDNSFSLLPHSSNPNMELVRDGSGNWTASAGTSGGDGELVASFGFLNKSVSTTVGTEAEFEMEAEQANGSFYTLDDVLLNVTVNYGKPLTAQADPDGYYSYIYTDTLSEFYAYVAGNTLYITAAEKGSYTIQITLPPDITAGGKTLSDTAALTVTDGGTPPEPAPTLAAISVNSAGHKTQYKVGDALDVAGLTIEAVYSNGAKQTVEVTADMVRDFDSSAAADSQTLTIAYQGKETTYTVSISAVQTPDPDPGHAHVWDTGWTKNDTHHWHSCTAAGCSITDDRQKDGYAAHTPGDWITDTPASASAAGSRHKECTLCGHETERESIPATGGGSSGGGSTGGGSTGGGSTGGGSSGGGWSSGGSSGTVTTTQKNPDGSTTTTSTDRNTGTVTETIRKPDGSTVKTVTRKDGSSKTTVNRADKVTAEVSVDRDGRAQAQAVLPAQVSQAAQDSGRAVVLPIPALPVTRDGGASVTVRTGSARPVAVDIPLDRSTSGAVAVLTRPDGSQELVRTCFLTKDGLRLEVSDGASVTIKDNSKYFSDVGSHWAQDAINFVSARELFRGETASVFAPETAMNRAMVMMVLARLDNAEAGVSPGSGWYGGAMEWAVAQGISDGSDPEGQVTREQFVTMLYRSAGSPAATYKELHFSDAGEISGYALDAMRWAVEKGIVNGHEDGRLAPGGSTTRAQAAAMLARYISAK